MANAQPDGPRPGWQDWLAPRVQRRPWRLASGEIVDGATYRVVGGQREAFEALRSYGAGHAEPIVVDLDGLSDRMRTSFLDFLEGTGLTPLEWISDDVVVSRPRRAATVAALVSASRSIQRPRCRTSPPRPRASEPRLAAARSSDEAIVSPGSGRRAGSRLIRWAVGAP